MKMISSQVKMFFTLCLVLVVKDAVAYVGQHADNTSSPQLTPHIKLTFGDMKLTPLQRYAATQKTHKFNAIPGAHMRWKDAIIPYEIDCSIENLKEATDAIEAAMKEWEAKTCIRFVRRTHQKYYLSFIRDTHCWGNVGQVAEAKISVGFGCEFHHVMSHEIGHVVGLYHEHNRPDRDQWVYVRWENIGGFRDAFKIQANSEDLGVSYDYASIMHYPWTAFSANGRVTMQPRRSRNGKVPYVEISKDDVTLVSRMYNCPAIEKKRRGKRSVDEESPANDDHPCQDTHPSCTKWRDAGHCIYESVQIACPRSCRTCPGATKRPRTVPTTEKPGPTAPAYVTRSFKWLDQWPNRDFLGVGRLCVDYNKECWDWAKHGQCRSNPGYMMRRCMKSCKRMHFNVLCDVSKIKPSGTCNTPLGVGKNADGSFKIPDSAFRSSGSLRTSGWEAPSYMARLYNQDDYSARKIGAWCAPDRDEKRRYLQVDLQRQTKITYIATQGRPQYYERISEFKIEYSNNGVNFKPYQESGKDKVFYGNCDHRTPVINRFKNPIQARFVRYVPWSWNYPCVRLEFFGC